MLTDFNRIYPIEIEINNLKQTYNTRAIFTASDLHTSTLLIKIKEQGEPFKLTDCVVTALFSCVDSEIYKQETTVLEAEQGIVGIDLKHDVLQSGINSLCLKIVSNSTDIMYTPNMTYEVVNTVADGINAGDRLPIIEEILDDAQQTKIKVEELEKQIITRLETMDTDYQEFQKQVRQQMEDLKQKEIELTTKTDTKISEMDAKKNEFDETVANKISTWQGTVDAKVKEAEDSLGKINLAVNEFNNLVDTVTGKLVVGFEYDNATNSLKLTFDNGTVKSVEMLQDVPIASDSVVGGIKIGEGLSILPDGTLNVVAAESLHIHDNKAELDKITDGKVATWDAKETVEGSQAKINKTKEELNNKISQKSNLGHTHTKSEITDMFQVENSLESNSIVNAISVAQAKVIDDKVNTKETPQGSQAKADKSLQDAKQYTDAAIQTLVGTAPPVLDTIYEIATAIQENEGVVGKLTGEIAKKSDVGHTHTKSEITDMPNVIDGLDSTSTTDVLSANQGKLLNEKIVAQQDALSKVHIHTNKAELDKITDGKVATWDAKETVEGSQAKATKSLEDSKLYSDEKISEIREYVNTQIQENVGRETYVTTVTQWTPENGLYKATVVHHLNSENAIVCCTEKKTKENILVSYRVIDANSIEIINDANLELEVMIVSGALRKIEPTYGAEIEDRETVHNKTWSSEKIRAEIGEKQQMVDALDQLILTGAFISSPTTGAINWIWNSDKVGKIMCLILPDQQSVFADKTTLDSILQDTTARTTLMNNRGAMDTVMSQYGVKSKFAENIDIVIEMLKSKTNKDYLLSDKQVIENILNNVEDFNKFFAAFKEDEQMRLNILNSDYPYLREKMNGNQDVITYWLNYGNQDNFLVFKQLFADVEVLKQATVKNGLQYSYLEFVFIMQNTDYFNYACESGVLQGYINLPDERIHSILWNTDNIFEKILANTTLCDFVFTNQFACKKAFESDKVCDKILATQELFDKVIASDIALAEFSSSRIACEKMFGSQIFCDKVFATPTLAEKVLISGVACEKVFSSKIAYEKIISSMSLVDKVFASEMACEKLFESEYVTSLIFDNKEFVAKLLSSSVASNKLKASTIANRVAENSSNYFEIVLKFADQNKIRELLSNASKASRIFENKASILTLFGSEIAVVELAKSNVARSVAQNSSHIQDKDCLIKLYDTVQSCISKGTLTNQYHNGQDSVSSLNSYTNTSNSLVLCALFTWSSSSAYSILHHPNGAEATRNNRGGRTNTVTRDNINGLSFSGCTFTESGDGYATAWVVQAV